MATLKRTHSYHNNYDNDLLDMRKEYTYMLDDLIHDNNSELWANVKMIDFAHTYEADYHDIDQNYLNGLSRLIEIFEEFLDEAV